MFTLSIPFVAKLQFRPLSKISNLTIRRNRRAVVAAVGEETTTASSLSTTSSSSSSHLVSSFESGGGDNNGLEEVKIMSTSFESLKREAVHLERQLEDKVSRYQQMAQKINATSVQSGTNSFDKLSRAEQGMQDGDANSLQQDIQMIFGQLQDLIDNKLMKVAGTPSQRALTKRYREIILDQKADYNKAYEVLRRARERRELLAGTEADGGEGGPDEATQSLLRERNHINNSMNLASNVIGQAESVRQDLRWQGRSLRSAGSILNQLTTNIPGLNHLVEQVRRRRSQDDKIVAGVIAACIFFTLWYVFG